MCRYGFALVALAVAGTPFAAGADVIHVDSFSVSQSGSTIFTDTFGTGATLTSPTTAAGVNFSNGAVASYGVAGTITETGNQAILDTAKGIVATNSVGTQNLLEQATLLTPQRGTLPNALTSVVTFSVTGVFDLAVPSLGGAYGILLNQPGTVVGKPDEFLSLTVAQTATGPVIQLTNLNFQLGTRTVLDSVSLDASNQEILLELSLDTVNTNTIEAAYAYINNGVEGSVTTLATPGSTFHYDGFVQPAFEAFDPVPVPEPASLALFGGALAGLGFRRRRRNAT